MLPHQKRSRVLLLKTNGVVAVARPVDETAVPLSVPPGPWTVMVEPTTNPLP
ncbi:MAG: hypothetical protein HY208_00910 [Nitrospirae bacterium]|nr:hypothetical protein [Nitrospirota bacterium]